MRVSNLACTRANWIVNLPRSHTYFGAERILGQLEAEIDRGGVKENGWREKVQLVPLLSPMGGAMPFEFSSLSISSDVL